MASNRPELDDVIRRLKELRSDVENLEVEDSNLRELKRKGNDLERKRSDWTREKTRLVEEHKAEVKELGRQQGSHTKDIANTEEHVAAQTER